MFYRAAVLFSKYGKRKPNVLLYSTFFDRKKPIFLHTTFNRTFKYYSETTITNLFYQIKTNNLWTLLILNNLSALDLSLNLNGMSNQTTRRDYYEKLMRLQRLTYDMQCRYIPPGRKLTMTSDFLWDFEKDKRAKLSFVSCKSFHFPLYTSVQSLKIAQKPIALQETYLQKFCSLEKQLKEGHFQEINHDIDLPLSIIQQMKIFKLHEYAGIKDYVNLEKKP